MSGGSRFLAVVPARGGSSGLPGKNLKKVRGISLVSRSVLVARRIEEIRWILVSTDDGAIAREAEEAGASVPFFRPPELSGGEVPMVLVLRHAVEWFRENNKEHLDGLVLLQPTSPMRTSTHVREAISLFEASRKSDPRTAAVISVSPVPPAFMPEQMRRLDKCDEGLWRVGKAGVSVAGRPGGGMDAEGPLFYRNGAAVVLDPDRLDALTLNDGPVIPYVVDRPLVSIDSMFDLLYVEHCGGSLEPGRL